MELFTSLRRFRWWFAIGAAAGLAALYYWLTQPISTAVPMDAPTSEITASAAPARMLVVDVVGAVRSPGVVELPAGSRVMDAVAAAGGLKPKAVAGVNLARVIVDGEQIIVGQSSSNSSSGKLNLNTADEGDLEELPGVGPVMAQRIIEYRTAHGLFRSVNELDAVSGIGPALMKQLRDLVTVG